MLTGPSGTEAAGGPVGREARPGSPHESAPIAESHPLPGFENAFESWGGARRILLAVSGGPDSVALMLLAADWAREERAAPALEVATVDHGLRPGSRAEAESVARWAAALGLRHEILSWEGDKPASRIQERAREARYRLLYGHARAIGAGIVATAHHADDQAETILFRLLRGSGLSGLAGMEAACARGDLIHSRPLLACAKADLVMACEGRGHPFVRDPANENPAFARARLRAQEKSLAALGLDREALLRLGRRAARADEALAARAAAVRAALPSHREPQLVRADISMLADEPEEIVLRILSLEIRHAGGQGALRLDRLEALTSRLRAALRAGAPFAATLCGASLRLGPEGSLTIRPEPPRRRKLAQACP